MNVQQTPMKTKCWWRWTTQSTLLPLPFVSLQNPNLIVLKVHHRQLPSCAGLVINSAMKISITRISTHPTKNSILEPDLGFAAWEPRWADATARPKAGTPWRIDSVFGSLIFSCFLPIDLDLYLSLYNMTSAKSSVDHEPGTVEGEYKITSQTIRWLSTNQQRSTDFMGRPPFSLQESANTSALFSAKLDVTIPTASA